MMNGRNGNDKENGRMHRRVEVMQQNSTKKGLGHVLKEQENYKCE